MGQCYDVKLKLKFRDKEKDELRTIKAMQKYIKTHDGKGVKFNLDEWKKEGNKLYSLEDMLRVFFAGWNCWDFEITQGRNGYMSETDLMRVTDGKALCWTFLM